MLVQIAILLLALLLSRVTSFVIRRVYNRSVDEWQANAVDMVTDPKCIKTKEFDNHRFKKLNPFSRGFSKKENFNQIIMDVFCVGFFGAGSYLLWLNISLLVLLILGLLILVLSCHVLTDCHSHILLDEVTYLLLWAGLLSHVKGMPSLSPDVTMQSAVVGAFVGYAVFWLIAKVFKVVRGIDGLGMGDFKLMAVFGAWLGAEPLIWVALIGSLIGLVGMISTKAYLKINLSKLKEDEITKLPSSEECEKDSSPMEFPFGPSLCVAFLVVLLMQMSGHSQILRLF